MITLITKLLETRRSDGCSEYKNIITAELDMHVLPNHIASIDYGGGSYLDGFSSEGHLSIRFPGATRGFIEFNVEGIITSIHLFNDEKARCVQCYKQEAYNLLSKYIGMRLNFESEVD